ncbi:RNA-binding protein 7 [Trichonephila inaurata madagascariensis]|uniref:RNA-binding protein 7 n=1 Tax=Trichonephila inaurata madagascariensis TaxID=2747483 RepID=A0A8X6XUW6_9ARAC|nr:RNA-binding protein 7 [Trichonephila inaurata madagascariensis]
MTDKERTLYCGNLSEKVTEDLLYELFLQAGPLECVKIPKDKDGRQRNYGFVTFKHAISVPYSVALMGGLTLYGKPIRLDARSGMESVPNPYLEQLRQYEYSFNRQSYHQNDSRRHDNRSRRHDSRSFVPRESSHRYQHCQ